MQEPSAPWRPPQFSLRTILIALLLVALAIVNWKFFFYWAVVAQFGMFFWPTFLLFGLLAWNLGQLGPPALVPRSKLATVLAIAWLLLLTAICLYSLLIRYRWSVMDAYFGIPVRPFPFPDYQLHGYERWLDKQYPALGYIKLRGESTKVWLTVNPLCWAAAAMLAFQLGLSLKVERRFLLIPVCRRLWERVEQFIVPRPMPPR
ncbi:hypothetical protein NA78x_004205 [Anatilimnocola sp. NA78]|uniref:hypothetical protein n=1 Tax=Anatilimnocola sp. NA78 TaxID=3415683 RepID=UPI003CE53461